MERHILSNHRVVDGINKADCSVCGPDVQTRSKGKGRKRACLNAPHVLRARANEAGSHGLTTVQAKEMTDGKPCEMCGSYDVTYVDHCHDTGKIRGILCRVCNTAFGMLGDGRDIERLEKVLWYAKERC